MQESDVRGQRAPATSRPGATLDEPLAAWPPRNVHRVPTVARPPAPRPAAEPESNVRGKIVAGTARPGATVDEILAGPRPTVAPALPHVDAVSEASDHRLRIMSHLLHLLVQDLASDGWDSD